MDNATRRTALANSLYAQARIVPLGSGNRVNTVTKLEDGGLLVALRSGESFTISQQDDMFQSFVVWMVLNPDAA